MRILFLDTETNGLPQNRWASYTMPGAWPALVQVAWQVWDFTPNSSPVKLYDSSFLVKPAKGQIWNADAAAIHNITECQAQTHGVAVAAILAGLASDAAEADIVVAHNLGFDKPVLWAAAHGVGLVPTKWWPKHEICTMMVTKAICKIPSTSKYATTADPYKWPKLAEVWQTLFPTSALPENLHDARQDVAVLVTCFHELVDRNLLVLPIVPVRRCDRFADFFRRVLEVLAP